MKRYARVCPMGECGQMVIYAVAQRNAWHLTVNADPDNAGVFVFTNEEDNGLPVVVYAPPGVDVGKNRYSPHFTTCNGGTSNPAREIRLMREVAGDE